MDSTFLVEGIGPAGLGHQAWASESSGQAWATRPAWAIGPPNGPEQHGPGQPRGRHVTCHVAIYFKLKKIFPHHPTRGNYNN